MIARMTFLICTAVCLISLGAASEAEAEFSVFGGANFPTGDFNADSDIGWTLGGYLTTSVVPVLLDVGLLVGYNDFSNAFEDLPIVGDILGNSFNAWEIQALGQVNVLFLRGYLGLGVANYSGVNDDLEAARKTKFAWQLGVAAKFLILEGRLGYHNIPTDEESINWVGLSVGVVF